jgi:23S rRNA U2552 (ribose-2'-O)-methylase RlmE/FtsJ
MLNEAIEKIQQHNRRREAYEKAYSHSRGGMANQSMRWVYQVDGSYLERFRGVLSRIVSQSASQSRFAVCPAPAERGMTQGFRHFEVKAALVFVEEHVILKGLLPFEFLKHVHKIMLCDRVCSDPATLISNVTTLLRGLHTQVLLKIQSTPKYLEDNIVTIMGDEYCNFTGSENKYTHLLQVAYCPITGNIHYGLVDRKFSESHGLTSEALVKMKLSGSFNKNGDEVQEEDPRKTRPCRAYYKMSEVVESVFPSFGWDLGDLSTNDTLAMDVGASPGGWSQYVAEAGYSKVVAVDPGDLLESVLADQRITHLQCLVEDPQVEKVLRELTSSTHRRISMLVCDVNFAPWLAAKTLAEHCLPFLEGHGDCYCCEAYPQSRPEAQKSAYVVLTLKMMKHPKQHHIERAAEECKATMIASHTQAASQKCSGPCQCWSFNLVHLAANSANERTLICKLH